MQIQRRLCSENDLASFFNLHVEVQKVYVRYTRGLTVYLVIPQSYLSRHVINSDVVQKINCIVNVDQHKWPLSQGGHNYPIYHLCLCHPTPLISSAAGLELNPFSLLYHTQTSCTSHALFYKLGGGGVWNIWNFHTKHSYMVCMMRLFRVNHYTEQWTVKTGHYYGLMPPS